MVAQTHEVIQSLRAQLAEVEAEAEALRRAIEVIEQRSPTAAAPSMPSARRGRRPGARSITWHIRDLLNRDMTEIWTADAIYEAMLGQGWQPTAGDPVNGIRTALARLAERGEIRRVESGLYSGLPPRPSNDLAHGSDNGEVVAAAV